MKASSSASELLHSSLVAQDRPPGDAARRVDRQDRDSVASIAEVESEKLDQGALPRTGDAGYAHAHGVFSSGHRSQLLEHGLGDIEMSRSVALDQRDRPGQDGAVPRGHTLDVVVD